MSKISLFLLLLICASVVLAQRGNGGSTGLIPGGGNGLGALGTVIQFPMRLVYGIMSNVGRFLQVLFYNLQYLMSGIFYGLRMMFGSFNAFGGNLIEGRIP